MEWQPMGPPTPAPVPAPARRSRWPLILGAVAVGAGVLLILAVVGVLVLGIENPLTGIQVARDLKSAQTALDDGDYVEAVAKFSQVLDNDPDNAEAIDGQLEAAADLAQAEQFDAAIAAYGSVWQAKPGEVQALRGLGETYEAKGEWREAAGWYEKWTQAAPEDGNAFLALGNARFNLEEVERVVAAYERAGMLGASSVEMDAHLGLAYFELARYEEAVGHLQDAVGQNAEDSHLQRALGLAYFELGRYEEAVGHLRRAVAQNSEDFRLQRALGLSLYSLDQPEQAVEHLKKTCALGTDRSGDELVDVYYALGGYYFGERDYWQAIDFYEQAHELDPQGKTLWADESRANLDEAYLGLASNVMEETLLDLDFSNIVIEGDEIYAIAQTGHKAKIAGPVRVVDGPWAESQALVMEEGTTNECNDPSFEVETTSWVPASLGSIARNQDDAWKGTASLRCSSGGGQRYVQARYSGGFRSFDATVAYALSASYKLESLSAGGDVVFGAYWMGGANPDAYVQQAVGISEGGGWHRVSAVMTPDYDDRTEAYFYFIITGATADEQSFLLDAFQVERDQAYATSYADGSLGDHYGWLSTPHASASTRLDTWATVPTAGIIDTSEGTIMIWFRFIGQETTHIRGLWSNHTTSDNMLQLFACWPSATDTTLFRSVGAERGVLASTELVVDRGWHQLVWTWNLESRLYIDGSLAATYSGDAWDGVALASDLYLGREVYSPPAFLNGAFARFVAFERTLSAREVRSLYRAGVPASR
jgi:tetratricopeptide (TPR) repeat protein